MWWCKINSYWLVENRKIVYIPPVYLAPRCDPVGISLRCLIAYSLNKNDWACCELWWYVNLSRFDTIPERDGQTDGQTHTVSEKNAPTLAYFSLELHGLILLIFGTQNQNNCKNNVHIQLSMCLHFYKLYWHLNCNNENYSFLFLDKHAPTTISNNFDMQWCNGQF